MSINVITFKQKESQTQRREYLTVTADDQLLNYIPRDPSNMPPSLMMHVEEHPSPYQPFNFPFQLEKNPSREPPKFFLCRF